MKRGQAFERRVLEVIQKMGFQASETRVSGDGGIDIIAYSNDPLVAGKYIIQCKDWDKPVGEPELRDLYGVVHSENANKGILITTSRFTGPAVEFAKGKQLELIDGETLGRLSGGSDSRLSSLDRWSSELREKDNQRKLRIEELLSYVSENPRNLQALKELGDLHVSLSATEPDWKAAIVYYDRIVAIGLPRVSSAALKRVYADALHNKAACHIALGDMPEGYRWLLEARRYTEKGSVKWSLMTLDLGKLYHFLEMYDDAVRLYQLLGEDSPLLHGELELALMGSQPEDALSVGLWHLDTPISVAYFPDPADEITKWLMGPSEQYRTLVPPFTSWLRDEPSELTVSSLDDIREFAEKCLEAAEFLHRLPRAEPPEYLRSYAELGIGVCEQEKAILRVIAVNLLRTADNARSCEGLSLDVSKLRDTIREEIFGAGDDAPISELASIRASLMGELHAMHEETIRAARRGRKEQWRSAIRRAAHPD